MKYTSIKEAFPTIIVEKDLDCIKVGKLSINETQKTARLSIYVTDESANQCKKLQSELQKQLFDSYGITLSLAISNAQMEKQTDDSISATGQNHHEDNEKTGQEEENDAIRQLVLEASRAREEARSQKKTQTANTQKDKYKTKYAKRDINVIYGREKELVITKLEDITEPLGEVAVHGQVSTILNKALKNSEKVLITLSIYDGSDSISCKCFFKTDQWSDLQASFQEGSFYEIQGKAEYDSYDKCVCINSVSCIKKIGCFFNTRMDDAEEKRVELHCHTKMSEHDAVIDPQDVIKRAVDWGHDAVAITDHGVVHAFTDVYKYICKKKVETVKPIYGLEGYLVDDMKKTSLWTEGKCFQDNTVVYSIRTTGSNSKTQEMFELAAVTICKGNISDSFHKYIKTNQDIPFRISEQYELNQETINQGVEKEEALKSFMEYAGDSILAAYTLENDLDYLLQNLEECGLNSRQSSVDITAIARVLLPELRGYKIEQVAKHLSIAPPDRKKADLEVSAVAKIYMKLLEMASESGIEDFTDLNIRSRKSTSSIKKSPRFHIILLAADEEGRSNLYRIVSASHLEYFHVVPRIPRSLIMKHRKGLIIGSACEAGELIRAVIKGKNDRTLKEIASFYDYLEVQPIANNGFMLRDERYDMHSLEDLRNINRKVVELGDELGIPVAATCDAHFLDPEDEIYRRIIQDSRGYSDVDESTPLYFRTTQEMLNEFSYLGEEKAYEVVVKNTRAIADRVKYIAPVRAEKCTPVIDGAEDELKNICYEKAKNMYGEPLPHQVKDRLEKELHSIISNGYASLYIIAERLVKNSNENGYLVGSRGSVGSSFVATMAGISEVNPLPPHYYCPNCQNYEFDSEEIRNIGSGSGCDLPGKLCSKCGKQFKKDGFSIPFETFLGFKGDKEPDIDLNFSGEYQTQAHAYTEVIFGQGHTFKAGTIGTLAEKIGFLYARDYYEKRGISKRQCELERIGRNLQGVRRTTGQHPGGIVVLPKGEEIHTFTPVQHPANDINTNIITTHFDYHSIEHNLLKLDILGKDDPTVVRIMQDLTGVDPESIPIDDPKIMSLFKGTQALGIKPEDIGGCPLGCLGIPEFGTDFVIQMLIDTKPETLSDLVRISGLSHGTDVWVNNAQTLIKDGKTTLEKAICTRDDIMLYLIEKGVDSAEAFKITESVRKGRGLSDEWKHDMKAHDVPDWYIWSCERIQYMFPKAHAAAYVMMACRIAYYKIYYPLAYYAAYLAIRGTGFKYGTMAFGKGRLEQHFMEMEKKSHEVKLTATDNDEIRDMKIVREFYARGFEFAPIDLYKAKANRFLICDEKRIMPSLASIDGMGDKAASAVELAASLGVFLSKEDMQNRTRISKTLMESMENLGILCNMADTNQMSLFDFDMM